MAAAQPAWVKAVEDDSEDVLRRLLQRGTFKPNDTVCRARAAMLQETLTQAACRAAVGGLELQSSVGHS